MKGIRICFSILLVLDIFLLAAEEAQATEEFTTRYEVTYQFHPSGLTTAGQKISLTNKLSHVYATEYSLNIDTLDIQNVKAWDNLGPMQTSVSREADHTSMNLVFNEKVVGKDETLNFTLEYQSYDFAIKKGQIWEITIPRLANVEQIDEYLLILNVPVSFGPEAYLSPQPSKREPPFYYFDKLSAARGITAAFGNFQIFDFQISYQLQNPSFSLKEFRITLPPDTSYQKVILSKIEPKPKAISVDQDGNWLAHYQVEPKRDILVVAVGTAQVFLEPTFTDDNQVFNPQEYLKSDQYWEVNDQKIQDLAENLNSPRKIYDYVIQTLNYDYQKIGQAERLGAKSALDEPDAALCMEFTDLFVTLSRAAGIPSREINGYAYTENPRLKPISLNKDILHAWPEYWDEDKKAWVPVDPTWEETTGGTDFFNKMDLNHFVLVIHGQKSDFPYPPGHGPQKNIQINFAQKLVKIRESLKVEFDLPPEITSGQTINGQAMVVNTGNVAFHNLDLLVDGRIEKIKILPPFSSHSYPVSLGKTAWWKTQKKVIVVNVNHASFQQEIFVKPFFYPFVVFLTKIALSVKNLIG